MRVPIPRWILFALGVWLFFAPHVLGYWSSEPEAGVNDLWAGIALVMIGSASFFAPRVRFAGAFLGLWLIFAPVVLGYVERTPIMMDVAAGLVALAASLTPAPRPIEVGQTRGTGQGTAVPT
jgi:hypothetical protein